MNELKNIIFVIIAFIIWSAVCVGGGWLFCNKRTIPAADDSNIRYAEQQQKYESIISSANFRIAELERLQSGSLQTLFGTGRVLETEIQFSGQRANSLAELIHQIGKQKIILEDRGGSNFYVGADSGSLCQ